MRIAYVTGDIQPTGNFAFFHDLLANLPVTNDNCFHRVYLVNCNYDKGLINHLKERCIDVRECFEEFHADTDAWWEKIRQDTEDCDVLISGNITNLDEVLSDKIKQPIVSVSLAQHGYRSETGNYGSFYKGRFHKVAVSKTAIEAFPKDYRADVEVIPTGLDAGRIAQKAQRDAVRNEWFPGQEENVKLILFIGIHQPDKQLDKLIEALEHLPPQWRLIVVGGLNPALIPEHLRPRVSTCRYTFYVGDLYQACDCFVLPTKHEGLNTALLEAWYHRTPTVTTNHDTITELQIKHPDTDFGTIVDIHASPKELAKAITEAKASESANQCVLQHYMAANMVEHWQKYLKKIVR